MYKHILETHRHDGEWLFLHYHQVLAGEGLDYLEVFVDAQIDRSFPDPTLRRSFLDQPVSAKTWATYQKLCKLAGYKASAVEI